MSKSIKYIWIYALILCGCITPPFPVLGEFNTINVNYSISTPGKLTKLKLALNAANLAITGGTPLLMDSTFYYNIPAWKPAIRQNGNTITINHPNTGAFSLKELGGFHYDIDIKFNQEIPLVFSLDMQQGSCQVFFDNLNLQSTSISTGDSDCTISFVKEWQNSIIADIKTGHGQTIIRIPQKTGTIIKVAGLLSQVEAFDLEKTGKSYTNSNYGKTPATLTINIDAGTGPVLLDGSNW